MVPYLQGLAQITELFWTCSTRSRSRHEISPTNSLLIRKLEVLSTNTRSLLTEEDVVPNLNPHHKQFKHVRRLRWSTSHSRISHQDSLLQTQTSEYLQDKPQQVQTALGMLRRGSKQTVKHWYLTQTRSRDRLAMWSRHYLNFAWARFRVLHYQQLNQYVIDSTTSDSVTHVRS